jgi:methylmalonyl-CoA mutase N-terminal domain/subunit
MESAYRYQRAVEGKQKIIVGVNEFTTEVEQEFELLSIDEGVAKKQNDRLKKVRASRNSPTVNAALAGLRSSATGRTNLLPHILECVEAYASVGEISDALREVWGEYKE